MKNTSINTRRGNKKLSLILVLRALEQCSDAEHPIKQITLAKMVNDIGGALNIDLWCDRKTVGRHLKLLKALGYKIITVKRQGFYIETANFTIEEKQVIENALRQSPLVNAEREQLISKLYQTHGIIDINKLKKFLIEED